MNTTICGVPESTLEQQAERLKTGIDARSLGLDSSENASQPKTALVNASRDTVSEFASSAAAGKGPGYVPAGIPGDVGCKAHNPHLNQVQSTSRAQLPEVHGSLRPIAGKIAQPSQEPGRQTSEELGRIDAERAEQAKVERERADEATHAKMWELKRLSEDIFSMEFPRPLVLPKSTFPQGPVIALSLDAGGCGRTMVQLEILAALMDKHSEDLGLDTVVRPSDVFHLIVGSGTGALIAVLLGRLHMTVGEAIEFYQAFEENVFYARDKLEDTLDERQDLLAATSAGARRARRLTAQLNELVRDRDLGRELRELPIMGSVLITARQQCPGRQEIRSFRSHYCPHRAGKDMLGFRPLNCSIVEAVRAAMAHDDLLGCTCIDGEQGSFTGSPREYDNPVELASEEADKVFGVNYMGFRERVVISVGAGSSARGEEEGKAPDRVDGREDHYFRLNRALDCTAVDKPALDGEIKRAAAKIKDMRELCIQKQEMKEHDRIERLAAWMQRKR